MDKTRMLELKVRVAFTTLIIHCILIYNGALLQAETVCFVLKQIILRYKLYYVTHHFTLQVILRILNGLQWRAAAALTSAPRRSSHTQAVHVTHHTRAVVQRNGHHTMFYEKR